MRCLRIRCKLSLQIPYIASTVLPKRTQPHPIFGACLLGPNGWMDQDATWYGGKPRRRRRVRYRVGTQFPLKGTQPPVFGPGLLYLWANGCMDEDATLYGSRPRPRPQCVRRGPSSLSRKRGTTASLFSAHVYCGHCRPSQLLLSSYKSKTGHHN